MNARPAAVLFACNFNRVRSPMAEGLVRGLYGDQIYVDSCGLRPDAGVDPLAIEVMAEVGVNIVDHVSMDFDALDPCAFDLVVAFTPEAHARALEMVRGLAVEVEYWPLPDPTLREGSREVVLGGYREVRDILIARLPERLGAPLRRPV